MGLLRTVTSPNFSKSWHSEEAGFSRYLVLFLFEGASEVLRVHLQAVVRHWLLQAGPGVWSEDMPVGGGCLPPGDSSWS